MVQVQKVFTICEDGKTIFQVFLDNGKTHIGDTERENLPEVGMIFPNEEAFYGFMEV